MYINSASVNIIRINTAIAIYRRVSPHGKSSAGLYIYPSNIITKYRRTFIHFEFATGVVHIHSCTATKYLCVIIHGEFAIGAYIYRPLLSAGRRCIIMHIKHTFNYNYLALVHKRVPDYRHAPDYRSIIFHSDNTTNTCYTPAGNLCVILHYERTSV